MSDTTLAAERSQERGEVTTYAILLSISLCHLLNDVMQSLLAAIYPMLKTEFSLDFWQIGMLTFCFQVTASLLQPVVGIVTDRRAMPWSLPAGMGATMVGLVLLAWAPSYALLIAGACLIGLGSAVFHPEASRVARAASGGRYGLAQSVFQVGGNFGTAIGPLLAAFIVVPWGRPSVAWFALGYSIAFGGDGMIWGGLDRAFLNGVTADTVSGTIPEVLFFAFQMTFAIITPALIVGAYVERIGFGFVLLFSLLWMLLCYAPVAHWIWGGGMLADGGIFGETGVKDFAGGIVVHETAGLAAILIAVFLGPRKDHSKPPHNPGFVMIGASMLWVGWFGFNGGSQLAADGGAAMAMTVTHISAAAASLTWALWEKIKFGKASLVGMVTGTIAGLASITPASGFVGPVEALVIGLDTPMTMPVQVLRPDCEPDSTDIALW